MAPAGSVIIPVEEADLPVAAAGRKIATIRRNPDRGKGDIHTVIPL